MVHAPPVSVVETPTFLSAVRKLIPEDDRVGLVDFLAHNPTAGDLIVGTGGIRKLRWGLEGRGKRGGARVIYFYHDTGMPLFILTAYAKNQQSDLSAQDRDDFRELADMLIKTFRRRR